MAKIGIQKWRGEADVKEVGRRANKELYPAAQIVEKHVKRKLRERMQKPPGDMYNAIKVRKSRYHGGGYIIGVFDEPTAKWEDSLGARAIFFEFGRAAPGQARSRDKAQPPRPFFRPALISSRREIRRRLRLRAR